MDENRIYTTVQGDMWDSIAYNFYGDVKYIGLLLQMIDKMDYSLVIFDTAPTGHTLKLLEMPMIIGKSMEKILELKLQFSPVIFIQK